MEKFKKVLGDVWVYIKKWFIKLKPIKYISLLRKYNQLSTRYNALLDAVKDKCFEEVYSRITIPEQLQRKDRRIRQLERKLAKYEKNQ